MRFSLSLDRRFVGHGGDLPEWLYVEYRAGARELYDLAGDPYELRSLDTEPGQRALRAALPEPARVTGGGEPRRLAVVLT